MFKKIESPQNATVKQLVQLREKSRVRKQEQLFLVEGVLELQLALKSGYECTQILVCFKILSKVQFHKLFNDFTAGTEIIEISEEVYKKLAYRTSTEGVIGIAKMKDLSINSLELVKETPLILVAEAPEKPGNIGAILRTADAANVDAVLIANPKTGLYNPNIIRSSVGGFFTNKIAIGTTEELLAFLKEKGINIYTAILQESVSCYTQDFTTPTAIVVGAEHEGLSEDWRKNATQNIHIPMSGSIDSMNVSVAAAILIFEAKRQRGF